LFFARPLLKLLSLSLFSKIGIGTRRQDVLPAPLFTIFCTSGHLSLPQSKIRAGKLFVDSGHFREELVGGHPHHCYRRACCLCPVVDRALQRHTQIADDHAKK